MGVKEEIGNERGEMLNVKGNGALCFVVYLFFCLTSAAS